METVFASFTSSGITVSSFLICSLVALLCGALIAFTYTRRTRFTQSLVLAVILLPFAVQTVIMLVNGNVGTGVAVAGAFGLVRFRSAPGNAKDISVIFVAMAVGLACGSGYIALSVLFTVIACAVLYLLVFFHIGADRSGEKELSITIPESLDYTEVLDDIFKEYTTHAELTEVKTASLGSLYKLHYRVRLADGRNEKEFLDALPQRQSRSALRPAAYSRGTAVKKGAFLYETESFIHKKTHPALCCHSLRTGLNGLRLHTVDHIVYVRIFRFLYREHGQHL